MEDGGPKFGLIGRTFGERPIHRRGTLDCDAASLRGDQRGLLRLRIKTEEQTKTKSAKPSVPSLRSSGFNVTTTVHQPESLSL